MPTTPIDNESRTTDTKRPVRSGESRTTATKRPVRSGGPHTDQGKYISSRNATKHGMRSKTLILPDELEDDYQLTREGWFEEFRPKTFREERLVDLLTQADWFLQRAHRRMEEAEAAVIGEDNTNPADWTAEQVRTVELMQRYKTTAERAFYRALNACEQTRKDNVRSAILEHNLLNKLGDEQRKREEAEQRAKELEKKVEQLEPEAQGKEEAKPLSRAEQVFQGQRSKKKRKKIVYLDQWVEVEVSPAGKTITTAYPSNEILIAGGQKLWPPPEFVYRRFNFVDGVPEEYAWATDDETTRQLGGMGIQRMTVDTWLDLIDEEKELGTGHMLSTGTLPRPEEHGGCDCNVCSHNRKVLEEAA